MLLAVLKIATLNVLSINVSCTKNSHQLSNLTVFEHQVLSFMCSISLLPQLSWRITVFSSGFKSYLFHASIVQSLMFTLQAS